MLSQCPQCRAVFNVSNVDIDAHHGLVRCGRCKAVFHAVTNEVTAPHPPRRDSLRTGGHEAPAPGQDPSAPAHYREGGQRAPEPSAYPEPTLHRGLSPATDDAPEPDHVEPVLPHGGEPGAARGNAHGLPGEITEEILIEAPPTVAGALESEESAEEPDEAPEANEAPGEHARQSRTGREARESGREPHAASRGDTAPRPAADERPEPAAARAPLQSPYRAKDVRMVELPQPRPFKTASLSLLTVFLVLLLVWQVKTFYLDDLAQVPLLRPYVEVVCRPLGCTLPPRRDFARIEVAGIDISINSEYPGALTIQVGLVNNAHFPQPYPPLRVTLTDRDGRIVGRRTYLPREYRPDAGAEPLPIREKRQATIDLAQPGREVAGYEVELVVPRDAAPG